MIPRSALGLRGLRFGVAVLVAGLAAFAAGCSDDPSGPAGPPPPDLSTPQSAVAALEDLYSRRLFDATVALYSPDFMFIPARPESISFLGSGETSWAFDREIEILERMLIPERITWLDQVLLEVDILEIVDSTATLVRVSTETELRFLLGSVLLESSRAAVDFVYEKNAQGDHILLHQRESLWPGSSLTYGELKARVEEAPEVATLTVDAGSVTATSAVLKGRVIANGLPTSYHFEWGPTASYGSMSPALSAGAGFSAQVFEFPISGLTAATEYHYRIVAQSDWGISRGDDLTFTTDP